MNFVPEYDLTRAKAVAEVVDRLVTVQVAHSGGGSLGLDRPINPILYDAARKVQNDQPLTYLAAQTLLENVKPGGSVILSSGFFVPPFMVEEVDGTFGIAALARSLAYGIDAIPIIVTEDTNVTRMEWLMRAVGLDPQPLEIALTTPHKCAIEVLPRDEQEALAFSERLLAAARPGAVVMSEKPSRNEAGVYHNGLGFDISEMQGKADVMIDVAHRLGIPTIGIGDGGNEIGMGKIKEAAQSVIPTAVNCGCPCGKGIAASSDTDVLVVAASANWGCYGIAAVLAAALGVNEVLHNVELEKRIALASVFGGLIDPSTGLGEGWTDGTEPKVSEAYLTLLETIVSVKLKEGGPGKVNRKSARSYDRAHIEGLIAQWGRRLNSSMQ